MYVHKKTILRFYKEVLRALHEYRKFDSQNSIQKKPSMTITTPHDPATAANKNSENQT